MWIISFLLLLSTAAASIFVIALSGNGCIDSLQLLAAAAAVECNGSIPMVNRFIYFVPAREDMTGENSR
jgi:hypothetical protein